MHSLSWIQKTIRLLTLGILPLLCVIYIPIVQDQYDVGRFIAITGFACIIIALWTISTIQTKKLTIAFNSGALGFALLSGATLLTTFVVSPNKIEALLHPLGPMFFLSCMICCLILPTVLSKKDIYRFYWTIILSIGLLGIVVIYQQFGITSILFPNLTYLSNPLWNPTGTPISAIYLFLCSIPLAVLLLKDARKEDHDRNIALSIISILVSCISIAVLLWRFLPTIPSTLLPLPLGWGILLETWKHPMQAVFGIGIEQFMTAYTQGKQMAINTTPLWNVGFSTNATLLFHIGTVAGILGICAFVWFMILLLKKPNLPIELRIEMIIMTILFVFFPPSLPLLILLTLYCIGTTNEKQMHSYTFTSFGLAFWILIMLSVFFTSFYYWYRSTNAERLYYQALVAKNEKNNGTNAYNLMILAMRQNPYMSTYHSSFAELNLMLGSAIIASAKEQQTGTTLKLTPEDEQLVSTLLSQAVREAKTATTLAPNNVYIWSSLAAIYESLIGSTNEARSWATAAYQKAITLDPVNPVLRLDLGGIYIGNKEYDNAIQQFVTAITLKPNYANAYYNLANALKLKGNRQEAQKALQSVLELLPQTSPDYQKVMEEIKLLSNDTNTSVNTSLPKTPSVPTNIPSLIEQ